MKDLMHASWTEERRRKHSISMKRAHERCKKQKEAKKVRADRRRDLSYIEHNGPVSRTFEETLALAQDPSRYVAATPKLSAEEQVEATRRGLETRARTQQFKFRDKRGRKCKVK